MQVNQRWMPSDGEKKKRTKKSCKLRGIPSKYSQTCRCGVGEDILAEFLKVWMNILAGTLVDILAEEKLVTCKNSMDILAEFFHR